MDLKTALENRRIEDQNFTYTVAARQLGVTRQHLGAVINGHLPAGRKLALKIIDTYPEVDLYALLNNKK